MGLNFSKPNGTVFKLQMHYLNCVTKEKKNSKILPDEGIFINHNNDATYSEIRVFADQEEGFDHVIFELKDSWKGSYVISM